MQANCPACRAEWTVADQSALTVSCPDCGQVVSSRAQTPLPKVVVGDTPSVNETREWSNEAPFRVCDIDTAELPVRMGRYQIESLIAEGGFSKVYLAIDEELGRKVALKIPRPEKFKNAAKLQQFLEEARLAAKLRHSGIVTIFDVGQLKQGLNYIAMEYIAGRPLSTVMATERLSFQAAAELLAKIAEAVHEAHLHGLIHRDIKPSNILLDHRGEPRVVDFGLAVHEDSQTALQGEFAGTPAYMSPEQFRGEVHRFDGRTDIWSLGCIFYQLLTGRRPFHGDLPKLRDEVQNRAPKPPRQIDDRIPRELEAICLKCLAKSIEDRYTTARDLADELRRWQSIQTSDGEPPSRPPTSKSRTDNPDPQKVVRSKGWIAVVAVAALVCASLGLFAAAFPTNRKNVNLAEPGPAARPDRILPEIDDPDAPIDKRAKPFVWLPLLNRKPNPLFWDPSQPGARWDYSTDRREVLVDSLGMMLAELGETSAADFKLQLTITKNSWTGSAGLFWGFVPDTTDTTAAETHRCQSLYAYYFHENSKPVLQLRRDQLRFMKSPAPILLPLVSSFRIADVTLSSVKGFVEQGERRLEVRIKDGQVVSVQWMGEEIESLHDSARTLKYAIPESHGRLGIINSFGTSRYRDARFQLLTPE